MKNKETLLIAALLLTTLAHVLDFVVMMPIGPKLMTEFSISAAMFGNLVSIYTIAAAFSSFLSTLWIDKLNKKHSLLYLLIGFSLGNALCIWAPTVSVLMIGRTIAGIFGGVMQAIVYSIIAQVISVHKQGSTAGIMGTAFPLVSIVGVPLGLRIADFHGWRMTFIMVLGVSVLAFALAAYVLPSMPVEKKVGAPPKLLQPIKDVLGYKPHRFAILLMFLTVMGGFIIVPYIAPFLINNGYILETELYLVYLVGGIFSIVSSRVVGGLADRFGKVKMMRVMLVLSGIFLIVFTNFPKYSLVPVLIITTCLMVALPGRFVCVMAWITTIGNKESRGALMSVVSTTQQLTIGLATLVGGMVVGEAIDGTFHTFWIAGICAVTANGLILFLTPVLSRIESEKLAAQNA